MGSNLLKLQNWIDRSPGKMFAGLSIFYLIVALTLSSFKLLWLDELITLHIARFHDLSLIWRALSEAVDPNPPLTYILVHISRAIAGEHEFALRLPDIVGYWIGLLSLFLYLKRYLPGTWAIFGTVISMTMAAFDYCYESRSYGIFYGLAMLAFLCWSWSVDSNRSIRFRRAALAGMSLSLAAGISTNYFAVLAFFPIAAGEIARAFTRSEIDENSNQRPLTLRAFYRRFNVFIWIGLTVAAAPLIAYRTLIQRSIAQFAPYAWNKVSLQQVSDSYTEMVEIILYPILGLFILGITVWLIRLRLAKACRECRKSIVPRALVPLFADGPRDLLVPPYELVGILFFMLYPILGYIIASFRGGMLSPRFVIPVCFGFAIAAAFVAFEVFRNVRLAGFALLCFVSAWFICREAVVGYWYEEQKQCFYKVLDRIPLADRALPQAAPIAIPDPLFALTFMHYASPALASRAVFPVDFPAVRHYRGDDSPDENLWAGRNLLYSLPILPLATFLSHTDKYLIIAGDDNWLVDDLRDHHYLVQRLPIDTRAQAIGGFTPLARGTPGLYTSRGDLDNSSYAIGTIRFRAVDDVPSAAGSGSGTARQ
jgi:hypothetical protein